MRILFLSFLLLGCAKSHQVTGSFKVTGTPDSYGVDLEKETQSDANKLKTGDMLVVYSASDDQVIGYLKVENPKMGYARLVLHENAGQVIVGDKAEPFDSSTKNDNVPGRAELLFHHRKDVSMRYKPIPFQTISSSPTATMLIKGQHFLGIFGSYGYGITNWFSVTTHGPLTFSKYPNVRSKLRMLHSDNFTLSGTLWTMYSRQPWTRFSDLAYYYQVPSR